MFKLLVYVRYIDIQVLFFPVLGVAVIVNNFSFIFVFIDNLSIWFVLFSFIYDFMILFLSIL